MKGLFSKDMLTRLALNMQRGDKEAAEKLYSELVGKTFGFCVSRVRHRHQAEDLTQEIFLKVVDGIQTFDPKLGVFSVWFWQLARNTLTDHYRRAKDISFSDVSETRIEMAFVDNPETRVEESLERRRLNEFLKSLPEEDQELFRLHYLADLSYREISKILNKSEGSLRVSVSRLKEKIRKHLK